LARDGDNRQGEAHELMAVRAYRAWLLGLSFYALLFLGGCAADSAPLQQARFELVRQQIALTKLHIELAKAALERMRAQKQQEQALAQSRQTAEQELKARRRATVVLLRNIASEKTGSAKKTYGSLADWVEAGGDPDRALQAALPGGITR